MSDTQQVRVGGSAPTRPRDWLVSLGIAVTAMSAAMSSFAGLRSLAVVAGWPVWLAWIFPLTVDAWAMTATRVWLAQSTGSGRARRFARTNAIGAICASVAGNAVSHLVAARLLVPNVVLVVAVGAVPALVLGLVAHLAVLRQYNESGPADDEMRTEIRIAGQQSVPKSEVPTADGPRPRTEDELLDAARALDAAHRVQHGRPLSRDGLRQALRVSGARATAVARQLRAERNSASATATE